MDTERGKGMNLVENALRNPKLTSMMKQYCEIKVNHPDSILFFRLGDFYEMFFDDAIEVSQFLDIALTGRECGLEERAAMCGVPHHAAQSYIDRLVAGGYKVAIAEQTEEAGQGKKLVNREVVRVITAGTVTSDNVLQSKANNYLCSVHSLGNVAGLAACDITTGELSCTEIWDARAELSIMNELTRFSPSEVIICDNMLISESFVKSLKMRFNCAITKMDGAAFESEMAERLIARQFGKNAPKMGRVASGAVGSLLAYLKQTQMCALPHIATINCYNSGEFMNIDFASKRSLEITETMRDGRAKGSLLSVIDKTATSMGGRLLRGWLDKPLMDLVGIRQRQGAVEELFGNPMACDDLRMALSNINDIERITGKVATRTANPRDLISLKNSLDRLPQVAEMISGMSSDGIAAVAREFDDLGDIYKLIDRTLENDPPIGIKEGGMIKRGFNEDVDRFRAALTDGTGWLKDLEAKERERTGIAKLKISFNRVAGYYIEVSKTQGDKVPERYVRKATLANAERYITGELKEIENSILSAQERNSSLEYQLYMELLDKLSANNTRILRTAGAIAYLDVVAGLAKVAVERGYIKPTVTNEKAIVIRDGRHAVVEAYLDGGEFVPNDTHLDGDARMAIITGPNMAGKSTYMRQVAVITLLAQIGSFVPASHAEIGICDKIFTRVGASDDLAAGQSTFMVEMTEVANILENATPRSLIILDEIGRGTSTYDGLAIAWAVAEHVADSSKLGAKALFATHYHEMTELEGTVDGVRNYCVSAEKRGDSIVFLRKVVPGGADDSYGIEVAKLAGVNESVVQRAHEIVMKLEERGAKSEDKCIAT